MMLKPDYRFVYHIRFRSVSSGIKNVQKYRVVLGFFKRARAGLRVQNHDPVPTLAACLLNRQRSFRNLMTVKEIQKGALLLCTQYD